MLRTRHEGETFVDPAMTLTPNCVPRNAATPAVVHTPAVLLTPFSALGIHGLRSRRQVRLRTRKKKAPTRAVPPSSGRTATYATVDA